MCGELPNEKMVLHGLNRCVEAQHLIALALSATTNSRMTPVRFCTPTLYVKVTISAGFILSLYTVSRSSIHHYNHRFLINIRNNIRSSNTDLSRDLISNSAEQRSVFAVISRVAVGHLLEFAILDGTNSPSASLLGFFEEDLVVLKAATTRFGLVEVSPDSSEHVREAKHEEEPVVEVVEKNGRQESNGKVGQAPDDNADGSALSSCGSREDLRGNEL